MSDTVARRVARVAAEDIVEQVEARLAIKLPRIDRENVSRRVRAELAEVIQAAFGEHA